MMNFLKEHRVIVMAVMLAAAVGGIYYYRNMRQDNVEIQAIAAPARCSNGNLCASGICYQNACVEACTTDSQCPQVGQGYYCHKNKYCMRRRFKGESCDADNQCSTGYCTNKICTDKKTPCTTNSQCSQGYCLNQYCMPFTSIGSNCSSNNECQYGCANGSCRKAHR